MKMLRNTLSVIALAMIFVSCNDNDDEIKPIIPGPPVGVEVKYEVSVTANMITKISYRMGDGQLMFGQPNPDVSLTYWETSLVALYSQMPEAAVLEVQCLNNTDANQSCTLNLYRNNVLIQTLTSPVAPADDDPETDDVVTVNTFTTITE